MGLTIEQRKDLRTALMSAFPSQPRLELMVEDELGGENLNKVTQGQPDYELVVRDLVRWAEASGKLPELVIGASRSNPGNPVLQRFVANEVNTLLEDKFGPITRDLTHDLGQILRGVNDFSLIDESAKATLPEDAANDRKRAITDLRNVSLHPSVRLYVLFRLLLHDYPLKNGLPSVLRFAEALSQSQGLENDVLPALKDWLAAGERHCHCEVSVSAQAQQQLDAVVVTLEPIDAYLLIAIEPQSKGMCLLKSVLQLYRHIGQEQKLQEEVPLDDGGDPLKKGILCSFEEVPNHLVLLVEESEGKLNQKDRRKRLQYKTYALTIEFFLPLQHLGACVDLWEIPVLGDPVPLGRQYRVTVRSYDRLREPRLLNALELAWENFQNVLKQQGSQQELQSYFEHLDCLEDRNWENLEVCLTQKVGLKMTCAPPQSELDRNKLFKSLIRGNVPLALWTRCAQLETYENWPTILDQFVTWDRLRDVRQLLESIKTERMSAYAAGSTNARQYLGYHLSVLCDDPSRIPPALDPLSESNSP